MRIEFVTDTYPPDINGVAMTLGKLTKTLKDQGHKVHVTHTGEVSEKGESSSKSFAFPGYKEVRVGFPSPFKFKRRWKKKRPDAIYITTESLLGMSAMRTARKLKIPIITGFHTNFQQYLKKYFISKIERPTMAYLKRFHKSSDCTMVPSQYMKQFLDQQGFQNVQIMGRGIDSSLYNPSKRSLKLREAWGASDQDCVITIVGRVAIEKNLDYALRTIKEIQKDLDGSVKLKTIIIGDGPLKQRLEKDYSENTFHFAGMQTGENLATHYASADVMLFASETETFGNVTLEALASGLITASYDYAAAAEHIQDGINGFKAPLSDENALKKSLKQAIEHRNDETMKQAAIAATQGISWSSIATQFVKNLTKIINSKPVTERRINYSSTMKVRSLFLSDIHLGTPTSKAIEVLRVLKHVKCKNLYLNGDIIEGNSLKRKTKWPKPHIKVIRAILKKANNNNSTIIYTRGNHDDFLTPYLPNQIGRLTMVKEYIHLTKDGKKYLVIHGDGFDSTSTNHRWLTKISTTRYDFLLAVNRIHNKYRKWRGKGFYSVKKRIKSQAKSTVTFIDKYEQQLYDLAKKRGCDGIICGHIHEPANKMIKDIHYLNSGDWVETMSCLIEDNNGEFKVLQYSDILTCLESPKLS